MAFPVSSTILIRCLRYENANKYMSLVVSNGNEILLFHEKAWRAGHSCHSNTRFTVGYLPEKIIFKVTEFTSLFPKNSQDMSGVWSLPICHGRHAVSFWVARELAALINTTQPGLVFAQGSDKSLT